MTNSNSHGTTTSHSVSIGRSETTVEQDFDLPDNFHQLAAMTAAAKAKMEELQTTGVTAMRERWHAEATALDKTPEEILGIAAKKRGRKPRAKRDE